MKMYCKSAELADLQQRADGSLTKKYYNWENAEDAKRTKLFTNLYRAKFGDDRTRKTTEKSQNLEDGFAKISGVSENAKCGN